MMLSILSCVCRPSVYLLWRNVYLGLLPIFGLGQSTLNFSLISLFLKIPSLMGGRKLAFIEENFLWAKYSLPLFTITTILSWSLWDPCKTKLLKVSKSHHTVSCLWERWFFSMEVVCPTSLSLANSNLHLKTWFYYLFLETFPNNTHKTDLGIPPNHGTLGHHVHCC